jgi:plasmid stabilization system protein ParE
MKPVRWSRRADRSLASIFRCFATENPEAGYRIAHRIVDAGNALGDYPAGRPGRLPRTFVKSLPDISCVLVYRVEGRGEDARIAILDVIHSRRRRAPG